MMTELITTKRDQMAAYQSIGITGEAAELLDKFSGNPARRHAWRVQQTLATADVVGEGNMVLSLIADQIGVGGRLGLTGAGTARHPAFSALGTGRKQANDGAAWMAAAKSTLESYRDREMRFVYREFGPALVIPALLEAENDICLAFDDCDLGEWKLPLLAHILRALALPQKTWRGEDDPALTVGGIRIQICGTTAEWASALNAALDGGSKVSSVWGYGTHYLPPIAPAGMEAESKPEPTYTVLCNECGKRSCIAGVYDVVLDSNQCCPACDSFDIDILAGRPDMGVLADND